MSVTGDVRSLAHLHSVEESARQVQTLAALLLAAFASAQEPRLTQWRPPQGRQHSKPLAAAVPDAVHGRGEAVRRQRDAHGPRGVRAESAHGLGALLRREQVGFLLNPTGAKCLLSYRWFERRDFCSVANRYLHSWTE